MLCSVTKILVVCKICQYISAACSTEREPSGEVESRKEAEENKENMRQSNCFTDASGIIYDIDSWNESVISGKIALKKYNIVMSMYIH